MSPSETYFRRLLENYSSTEFFLVCIFPYSVRIRENTDQEKLGIWTLFTQWNVCGSSELDRYDEAFQRK